MTTVRKRLKFYIAYHMASLKIELERCGPDADPTELCEHILAMESYIAIRTNATEEFLDLELPEGMEMFHTPPIDEDEEKIREAGPFHWCPHCQAWCANVNHPLWPKGFNPEGPDHVPPGFCNGIGCWPGEPGLTGDEE